jgi:hypothetical protein
MKKTFYPFLVAALIGACQQQKSATTIGKSAELAPSVISVPATAEKPLPVLFSATDTLSRPMLGLLREYDLAKLWRGDTKERKENPTLQGFFGPDDYRFALAITEAHRDLQHPEVYHVRGKCRYRKNIRPFTGTITVRQIADAEVYYSPSDGSFYPAHDDSMPGDTIQAIYDRAVSKAQFYTLRGQLQIQEEAAENSGVFEGEAILNFYTAPGRRTGYAGAPALTENEPARGSALLMRGARRNQSTRQIKKFVVADDVFAAAPDVLKDFGIGDRGGEINPKYAKLGWNELWENDEWWTDSPKPKLSL